MPSAAAASCALPLAALPPPPMPFRAGVNKPPAELQLVTTTVVVGKVSRMEDEQQLWAA